jgi:ribosomal-protein-alanine N-acetyltransferase
MIGTCDVFSVDWDHGIGEIGYVMHRSYWGRGYMTRVLQAVIAFAFEYLGLERIDIRHHPDNIGSRRVIEKCGFVPTGTAYYKGFHMWIPTYKLTKESWRRTNV